MNSEAESFSLMENAERLSCALKGRRIPFMRAAIAHGSHCPLFGVVMAAPFVAGVATLVVGTAECCWHSKNQYYGNGGAGHFYTYVLDDSEVVFGAAEGVAAALEAIWEECHPQAIQLVTSCVPELIGDSAEEIACRANVPVPVLTVRTAHYNSSGYYSGLTRYYSSFVALMEKDKAACASATDAVDGAGAANLADAADTPAAAGAVCASDATDANAAIDAARGEATGAVQGGASGISRDVVLLGARYAGYERSEIFRLLQEEGICPLVPQSVDDMRRVPDAALVVVLDETALDAAQQVRQRFGTPYVRLDRLCRPWEIRAAYQQIDAVIGSNLVGKTAAQHHEVVQKMEAARRVWAGKGFVCAAPFFLPLDAALFFADMGMISRVVLMREFFPGDDAWARELLERGHDPYIASFASLSELEEKLFNLEISLLFAPTHLRNLEQAGIVAVNPNAMTSCFGYELPMGILRQMERAQETGMSHAAQEARGAHAQATLQGAVQAWVELQADVPLQADADVETACRAQEEGCR